MYTTPFSKTFDALKFSSFPLEKKKEKIEETKT
jgi:hypothetical protein